MGVAIGRGIDVYVPDNCTLLNAPVYGYDAHSQHVSIDTVRQHYSAYNAALSILKANYAPLVERHKNGDKSITDEINERNPDLWLYDGAQAYLANLIEKYEKAGTVSRQVIERQRSELLNTLTRLNDRMNFLRGNLEALSTVDMSSVSIAAVNEELYNVVQNMHEHDGAIQGLNALKRHIDFVPYSLELEHSVK